jgi:hypothetical protein
MISLPSTSGGPAIVTKVEEVYYAGLDLGQVSEPAALACLRRTRHLERAYNGRREGRWTETAPTILQLGYIEVFPTQTPYPAIVRYVSEFLERPLWRGNIQLAIDNTGVGRPVSDMFRAAGITFTGVNITSGNDQRFEGNEAFVPKITLVSLCQALLHSERLHLHSELAASLAPRRELENFNVGYSPTGRLTFGHASGHFDDRILALLLAVWRSTVREHDPARFVTSFHMGR